MQSIEVRGLEELDKRLELLLKEAPEAKRKLHEELAVMAKQEVDIQIAASLDDSNGKIQNWQTEHVGSGGGYAAVRPTDKTTGDNSPGAITNYLESGHSIRPPSGTARRYKPKIKVPYVDGRHFYQNARRNVTANAIYIAEKFADDLAKKIMG